MTQFRIRDLNDGEMVNPFHATRKEYKKLISTLNENGEKFRVETSYVDGEPVKTLTILKEET